jgi:hypothetical protein
VEETQDPISRTGPVPNVSFKIIFITEDVAMIAGLIKLKMSEN